MPKCASPECDADAAICTKDYASIINDNRKLLHVQMELVEENKRLAAEASRLAAEITQIFKDYVPKRKRVEKPVQQALLPEALTPDDLMEAWNEICAPIGLAAIREIRGSRRQKALHRLCEHPAKEFWLEVFKGFPRSNFLQGKVNGWQKGHPSWKASFDWLVQNDINCIKVMEGRYS